MPARFGQLATLPASDIAALSPAWPCLLAVTIQRRNVVQPPAHALAPARALTYTRLAVLDSTYDWKGAAPRRISPCVVSCMVDNHVPMPSTSHLVVFYWSGAKCRSTHGCALRGRFRWRKESGSVCKPNTSHLFASFADGRAHATCDLPARTVLTSFFASWNETDAKVPGPGQLACLARSIWQRPDPYTGCPTRDSGSHTFSVAFSCSSSTRRTISAF